jgi:hypothetical protein
MAGGLLFALNAPAATYSVNQNSPNPAPPFADWDTAATNIQTAINLASAGDVVLVTNGVYAQGGVSMDGVITNCVAINQAMLVQSVNGPAVTAIQGAWNPATTNGPGAVRCAWLTNNATLSGFTLQGGATGDSGTAAYGGGVYGVSTQAMVDNCGIVTNSASSAGGGACQVTLSHCTLTGNQVVSSTGGGAYGCNLTNCWITSDFAVGNSGGGTAHCTAINCAHKKNSPGHDYGGAVFEGSLVNCTVTENTSLNGGAV